MITDGNLFCMQQPGRSYNSTEYAYGFNGKEKDDNGEFGLTHYDYGFRIYNPALGKFLSVDPLTRGYPMLTPYQFASNQPIWAIDIDGLERSITILDNTDNNSGILSVNVEKDGKESVTNSAIQGNTNGFKWCLTMKCRSCGKSKYCIKKGVRNGIQRFYCKSCNLNQ